MRGLIILVSLVALTGAAFAGEPQKSNSDQQVVASGQKHSPAVAPMRAPEKMTDQQLQNVVAGDNDLAMMNHDLNMSTANIHCVNSHAAGGFQGWHSGSPAAMAMPSLDARFCP